ncbi:MAG: S-layer homology domain-containing protein, partial [Clostridiales bacterium]
MPFADKAAIPTWAANSVKAIYSMGVISGYGSGKNLSFQPNNNITRAEALTMIGRVQQRGYVENE